MIFMNSLRNTEFNMDKDIEDTKIKQMDVEFLSESEKVKQREIIITKAFQAEETGVFEKLKKIYWGPGLKAVFSQCSLVWIVTAMVYGIFCITEIFARGISYEAKMSIAILEFPVCYLTFSFLACLYDEQENVVELKNTMHYSETYIVSLRMFYSSIILMFANIGMIPFARQNYDDNFWSIRALGITSMFIFAILSLYLYHRFSKSGYIGILLLDWCVISSVLVQIKDMIIIDMLLQIPLFVHLAVMFVCFAILIIYIGKVEKQNAYSFAC